MSINVVIALIEFKACNYNILDKIFELDSDIVSLIYTKSKNTHYKVIITFCHKFYFYTFYRHCFHFVRRCHV